MEGGRKSREEVEGKGKKTTVRRQTRHDTTRERAN